MAAPGPTFSEIFKVCFRFRGRLYKKSLKTKDRVDADIIRGGVERTLFRLEQNLLELPPGADIMTFALSDGKQAEKPSQPQPFTLALDYCLFDSRALLPSRRARAAFLP